MDSKTPLQSTADKMLSIKSACDAAPAGARKDTALKHYQAAEQAQKANRDGECNRQLDAAKYALT